MSLRTNYYLERWTDEVMPCAPTLEAWALWLDAPAPEWGRPEPASSGETFESGTELVIAEILATHVDGGHWRATPEPPADTDWFVLIDAPGGAWDADFSGDTIDDALDGVAAGDDDAEEWVACIRTGPSYLARFELTERGPRLVIVGAIAQDAPKAAPGGAE